MSGKLEITRLMMLLGRYFQIRDDYSNLASATHTEQKAFCEDLDEGKFSLIPIHVLANCKEKHQLMGILRERRDNGAMTWEMKMLVLGLMGECGSLEYVRGVLKELGGVIDAEIGEMEAKTAEKNCVLRLLVERLRVA